MKVTLCYLKKFGVKDSAVTETVYFVDKIEADPLYLILRCENSEALRLRQAHLLQMIIEKDPDVLIL